VNDGLPLEHMGNPCFTVATLIFFSCDKSGFTIATEMHAHYGHNQIAMVYRLITAYTSYVESSVQYDGIRAERSPILLSTNRKPQDVSLVSLKNTVIISVNQ
jgi:hypothetical protein